MRKIVAACIATVVLIGGCTTPVKAPLTTPFVPAEHEYARGDGAATISGQAFMRRQDGVVVYAAGSTVYIWPATRYTQEIFEKIGQGFDITNEDPKLKRYGREVRANGEGRFAFHGIPDGPYIVVTTVTWMAGDMPQGGPLAEVIRVSGGRSQDLVLTR